MARSFPPDVVILDTDGLLHARLGRGRTSLKITQAKTYRLAAGTFTPATVSPQLANEAALAETLRRLRNETGKWDKVSLLLPDSWFRINLLDVPSLPSGETEALEVVRWSLKRTLPISPELLRVSYTVLQRTATGAKVLVVSALEATLAAVEKAFTAQRFEIVLIEPVGLNIWNAITVRDTDADRLFLYVRETDFTTAVFRGSQPLFIRSRNLSGDRTLEQEIRLSANYLRDSLNIAKFSKCYLAGARATDDVRTTLAEEFDAEVVPVALRGYADEVPSDLVNLDAELTACTGVFTG